MGMFSGYGRVSAYRPTSSFLLPVQARRDTKRAAA